MKRKITMSTFELESYEKMIASKAATQSADILANAGPDHAAIAMSKLLTYTDHSVKMVVGSFEGPISNQLIYIEALKYCISKGVKFEIIFLDPPNFDSEAFKILIDAKENGRDITFKIADQDLINRLTVDNEPKHFSVYDDNKFRFEKDTKNYFAWFSFNDPIKTAQLKNTFDSKFNTLGDLQLEVA